MDSRGERRPLAPGCHVTCTKVRYGRNAGPLRNDRRFSDLERRPNGSNSGIFNAMRQMMHGLPVGSYKIDVFGPHVRKTNDAERRIGKPFTEQRVQMTEFGDGSRDRSREDTLLECAGIGGVRHGPG